MRSSLRILLAAVAAVVSALLAASLIVSASQAWTETGSAIEYRGPLNATDRDQIRIEGRFDANEPATLVLRIDDIRSPSYAERVNLERVTLSGKVSWTIPLKGLRTSGGRLIDASRLQRIRFFVGSGAGRISTERFAIEPVPQLPAGVLGLSFGSAEAPLFPGFTRVTPDDPRILGKRPIAVLRPGADTLIASGMRGLQRLHIPWPAGRARVALWTEDIGDWETLPAVLERRIRVNGVDIAQTRQSSEQWLRERYLRFRNEEAAVDAEPWQSYGSRRGGLVSAEVEVGAGGIEIELAGDSSVATFLSAALIEPAATASALDWVESERARIFRSAWALGPAEPQKPADAIVAMGGASELRAAVAPGSGVRLVVDLVSPELLPGTKLAAEWTDTTGLTVRGYAAVWKLERLSASSNLLRRQRRFLRSDIANVAIEAGEPRRFVLWLDAAAGASPGIHRGTLSFSAAGKRATVNLAVTVLPVSLPSAPRPAGFYLDVAPHWSGFADEEARQFAQTGCDLKELTSFGVTGNAPPLATPFANRKSRFVSDMLQALQNATSPGFVAYAPAKRLRERLGVAEAAAAIADVENTLRARNLPTPVWSIADEPSNPGHADEGLSGFVSALRRLAPEARLAAHLNSPDDWRFVGLFDTVLINAGFGLDAATIAKLGARGLKVWIYNTEAIRWNAGFGLAALGADRYLQWHARMPAADPFDPTDGREGDVQVFYPAVEPCAAKDINADLLEMAEGIVDQRWLAWLEARTEPQARALRASLMASAVSAGATDPQEARSRIIDLARHLY